MDSELERFDFPNVMLCLTLPQVLWLIGQTVKAYMKMVSQWNCAFFWNLNTDDVLILTDF